MSSETPRATGPLVPMRIAMWAVPSEIKERRWQRAPWAGVVVVMWWWWPRGRRQRAVVVMSWWRARSRRTVVMVMVVS